MAKENDTDKLGIAIEAFDSAQTREDYERALENVVAALPSLEGERLASGRLLRGKCLQILGFLEDAQAAFRKLLEDLEPLPAVPPPVAHAARLSLAETFQSSGRGREAIDEFLAVTPYFHGKGDRLSEGNIHRTVGLIWQQLGDLNNAIKSLQTSRDVLESVEPSTLLQQTLHALGHAHYLAGDTTSAIPIEEESLRLARAFKDEVAQDQLTHNLAELTFKVQDFRRAIKYISIRLVTARSKNDEESVLRYVSYLGACYTETGACRKALAAFDEVQKILSRSGREDSIVFAMAELGRAQVLVDLKRYNEACPILTWTREALIRLRSNTGLLDQVAGRLERETAGPLVVDCVHRPLLLALQGSTKGLSHSNPRPVVKLNDDRFLTSNLTEDDRIRFSRLAEELGDERFQTHYRPSGGLNLPGRLTLPLKLEYVDDVHEFEVKWNAFKQERENARYRADIQATWDEVKERTRFEGGEFRGDKVDFLTYLGHLATIAQAYAEVNYQKGVREVALHAADFVEIRTGDPMIAAAIWPVRLRLLVAAHAVSDSSARDLLEVEMRRCLDQERRVIEMLDVSRQIVALSAFVVDAWYEAARNALGLEGYSSLVDLVGGHALELKHLDRIRHAIAVGAADPRHGTELLDGFLSEVARENPGVKITLAPGFETERAVMRFRANCPDRVACEELFGPFAPYLHREVRDWTPEIFQEPPKGEIIQLGRHSVHAFTDGNLVVMNNSLGHSYVPTMMHEAEHQWFRAGRQLLAEDGRWFQVKRDVPTAAAMTYLHVREGNGESEGSGVAPGIERLIEIGIRYAQQDPERAATSVRHALRYFDDLATQETAASYVAGAILVGIAYGLYGADQEKRVHAYVQHLNVMDHDEAFEFGRREATLRL